MTQILSKVDDADADHDDEGGDDDEDEAGGGRDKWIWLARTRCTHDRNAFQLQWIASQMCQEAKRVMVMRTQMSFVRWSLF